jgi:ketosteroid isomerase-like protein
VKLPATPAAQIATVEEQVAAIMRGDFEAALRQASPDVELEIYAPQEFPFIRRARGIIELRKALQHNFGGVEDQQPMISNVLAQGDVVVMFGTERGRIRTSGMAYHVEFVDRFTFVDNALKNIRVIVARTT